MEKNTTFRKFLRFSGVGLQLGFMMYLGSVIGEKIDKHYKFEKPWITLLFVIIVLVIFVLNLMRQLNKLNKE